MLRPLYKEPDVERVDMGTAPGHGFTLRQLCR